jgi:hypothetical protein
MGNIVDLDYIQEITGMNDHDASNLMFLLSSEDSVLRDWYEKMDSDDHKYASELLYLFKEALNNEEIEVKLKKEKKFKLANDVIKKIISN